MGMGTYVWYVLMFLGAESLWLSLRALANRMEHSRVTLGGVDERVLPVFNCIGALRSMRSRIVKGVVEDELIERRR